MVSILTRTMGRIEQEQGEKSSLYVVIERKLATRRQCSVDLPCGSEADLEQSGLASPKLRCAHYCSTFSQSAMGKSRNQRDSRPAFRPYNKDSKSHKTRKNNQPSQPRPSSTQNSRVAPTIPFDFADRILLVGEGDFSFAHSLFTHHNCQNLVATCYDDVATLGAKYPQSTDYIRDLEDSTREDELTSIKIVYGVDATKMGKGGSAGGGKIIRKGGFDRIIFNFPHVGGLTKDVNRQVRHNQGAYSASLFLLSILYNELTGRYERLCQLTYI